MQAIEQPDKVRAALSGLRRVDCVKMVEDDRPRFFVVGVGHRVPVEREISPRVALALLRELPCRYQWRRDANGEG